MAQLDANTIRNKLDQLIKAISLDEESGGLFYGAIYAAEAGTWQRFDHLLATLPDYLPLAQAIHQQVRTVIAVTWLAGPPKGKVTVVFLVPNLNITTSVTIKVSDLEE